MTINGEKESFDRDPGWMQWATAHLQTALIRRGSTSLQARRSTPAAKAKARWVGSSSAATAVTHMMAFYGDRLEDMSLAKPLRASGKVALRRAVTDSDVLLGFFHAEHSLASGGSDAIGLPPDFIGVTIGGPSREGFMISPTYRLHNTERQSASRGPYLLPNGAPHDFSFEYVPGAEGTGCSIVARDGEKVTLPGRARTSDGAGVGLPSLRLQLPT